jgi:hypothetical protein
MEKGERRRGRRRSGYGSVPEEVTKRRSNRSDDGEAINTSESNGVSGSAKGAATEREWCMVRVNPNRPPHDPLLYSSALNFRFPGFARPHGLSAGLLL